MQIKKTLTSALCLVLATCGAPAYAQHLSPINLNEDKIASQVSRVFCERPIKHPDHPRTEVIMKSYGSMTRVGKSLVTAAHVANNCGTEMKVKYINDATDLAIKKLGNPGFCKDAEIGEVIVMAGYPASNREGKRRKDQFIKLEMEYGIVIERDKSIPMTNNNGIKTTVLESEPMDVAFTQNARSGYSGGGIFSAYDGRLVGIISAQSKENQLIWYIPISEVCKVIDAEN